MHIALVNIFGKNIQILLFSSMGVGLQLNITQKNVNFFPEKMFIVLERLS